MRIDEIISTLPLLEGINDPYNFKAVIMAGLPGSGKSTVIKKLDLSSKLKVINPDEVRSGHIKLNKPWTAQIKYKQFFTSFVKWAESPINDAHGNPEVDDHGDIITNYPGWKKSSMKKYIESGDWADAIDILHRNIGKYTFNIPDEFKKDDPVDTDSEYSHYREPTRKMRSSSIEQRRGILLDTTATYYPNVKSIKDTLDEYGYETIMIYVDVNMEEALDRARNRAINSPNPADRNRLVPPNLIKKGYKDLQKNITGGFNDDGGTEVVGYRSLFGSDNFYKVDNSGKMPLWDLDNYKSIMSKSDYKPTPSTGWIPVEGKLKSRIDKWLNTPATNPIATKWTEDQKSSVNPTRFKKAAE